MRSWAIMADAPSAPSILSDFDVGHARRRLGHRLAGVAQSLTVELDRLADLTFDFLKCGASGHTAGEIWHIGRVVPWRLLDDDCVPPHQLLLLMIHAEARPA